MTQVVSPTDRYAEDFRAGGPLGDVRADAFERFRTLGFPTLRHEDWRFTNVSSISGSPYRLAERAETPIVGPAHVHAELFDQTDWPRLVFVNGHFDADLSSIGDGADGVTVCPLAEAIGGHQPVASRHVARHARYDEDAFTALNTAFLHDGALVHVTRGSAAHAPIHVLFLTVPGTPALVTHPRVLVVAEAATQVTVIERHVGVGDGPAFTNGVCELVAADEANIDHYKVVEEGAQTSHVGTTWIDQGRAASVASHTVTLGGLLVRNNVTAVLGGEGGHCNLNGLYLLGDRQHADNFLRVEHVVPHCDSREYYKGILDDRSRAVFTGRIVVHEDAQKTDAKQTNMNLLLTPDAQVDTKPQLEIFADDVKCTHGATIGQIDDEQVFYLRARGIDEQAARGILLYAFAAESLDAIKPEPLRQRLHDRLFERLPQGRQLQEAM